MLLPVTVAGENPNTCTPLLWSERVRADWELRGVQHVNTLAKTFINAVCPTTRVKLTVDNPKITTNEANPLFQKRPNCSEKRGGNEYY